MRFVSILVLLALLAPVSGSAAPSSRKAPKKAAEPMWRILMDTTAHDFDFDLVLEFQAPGPGEGQGKVGFRSVAARPLQNRHDECQEQAPLPSRSTLRSVDVLRRTLKVLLEAADESAREQWSPSRYHHEMSPIRHECKANTGHRALVVEREVDGVKTRYRVPDGLSPGLGKYARRVLTDLQKEGIAERARDCRERIDDRWKEPLTRYFEMTRDRGKRRELW